MLNFYAHYIYYNTFRSLCTYNLNETAYIKKLIEEIATSRGSIFVNDAINLGTNIGSGRKISLSDAERVINRLIEEHWLIQVCRLILKLMQFL